MPIHEKSLIAPGDLVTSDKLAIDGIDVSGHWNTMMRARALTAYDPDFNRVIQKLPGGDNVHRCWQCGSCTNACTMYAVNTDFNPRYWIYCINLGLKGEIIKDKDIIWQCVSCHKCTNICPKDVKPEGVMKALALWLEMEGHTAKSPSHAFDEEFTRQCLARGRIEDAEVMQNFLVFKGENFWRLMRAPGTWLRVMVERMNHIHQLRAGNLWKFLRRMPIRQGLRMALAQLIKPRTKTWARTGAVLAQYVRDERRKAGLPL